MESICIISNSIVFGCMKGCNSQNNIVSVILYENIDKYYTTYVPRIGDILLCKLYHTNVYIPHAFVIKEHLYLRKTQLPLDVLMTYFPISVSCLKYKSI